MKKFEYMDLYEKGGLCTGFSITDRLNELGQEGWEVIKFLRETDSFTVTKWTYSILLKREII